MTSNADTEEQGGELVTDRRGVLRRAGLMAAGAAAGGTALALTNAAPASAAPGVFTGNPAVNASGTGGDGVSATTDTNGATAVYGHVSQKDAHGVFGRNTSGLPGTGMGVGADATGSGTALVATSVDGVAVLATSSGGGVAIHASSAALGTAVDAIADSGFAVNALSMGTAVNAFSTGGDAVTADSDAGSAVIANAQKYGITTAGAVADLRLAGGGSPPPARGDGHIAGELTCDGNGHVWLCIVTGSPGRWIRLAGDDTTDTIAAGALTMLRSPTRCYDSRSGYPPLSGGGPKGALTGGSQRAIDTSNNNTHVPLGATAVLVNLTVTNTSPAGFLALYSNALPAWPGTSSINWDRTGQSTANLSVVAIDASRKLKAYANTTTDFLIDVLGYYG